MKLLKAFSKYAIGTLMVLVVGFITTPILTRMISTSEMGKYSMFMTLGSLISTLLCLGLDQSYLRFYNEEKKESRNYLLNTCLKLPLLAYAVCSAVVLLLYRPVSFYIAGEKSSGIAGLFVVYMGALIMARFWSLKIQMGQREFAYSALNVIRKLVYLAAGVLLITAGIWRNSINLMLAITAAELSVLLAARIFEHGNWKSTKKVLQTSYQKLLKYGIPFTLSSTILLLFHSTDKIMLKALSDYENIGIYAGAQSIVNLLAQAQAVFGAFWIPTAYEHYCKDTEDKDFYVVMNKIVSYIMLLILILLICFKDVIVMLLGEDYRQASYVFPFLAFMPVMTTISETTVMGINFKEKTGYHMYISVISMVVNGIGNYFFITWFGATGAAISTGLSYSVFFILRTYFSQKVFPVNFALKRYGISAVLVYLLAIYASFYRVDLFFLLIAAVIIGIVSILYRDIISQMYHWTADYLKVKFSNKES